MQRVLLFTLFITLTYAEFKIETFGARHSGSNDKFGIYATHVDLEVKLTNCSTCNCDVKRNDAAEDPYNVTLVGDKRESGSVQISGLTPHTAYVFTLTCHPNEDGNTIPKTNTSAITTDYGQPPTPVNLAVSLKYPKLEITWHAPPGSVIPANAHQIKIDKDTYTEGSETKYTMEKDYVYGNSHTIGVRACRHNNQKQLVCSPGTKTENFFQESAPTTMTTTSTTTTMTSMTTTSATTTPKSTGVYSYSLSIPMIIFSLFIVTLSQW